MWDLLFLSDSEQVTTTAGAATVGDGGTTHSSRDAKATTVSKSERKVVKTMLIVVVTYVICWSAAEVCMVVIVFGQNANIISVYLMLVNIAYIQVDLPSGYHPFREDFPRNF